ncbi:MAG: ATP synthase F1 subunit gamma [Candidatus Delongbacteria bacterium]|nr:ATP synthase F1 subunit gamma [bacterium]MBL7033979.1 ATP synthase F1 subunit gamma [Candidatus Delongbacteria bacterium]
MANLKQIRKRITSVTSTQQITSAMKMVAAAKMRRAQENIVKARPYAFRLQEVMGDLARITDPQLHPLLARRDPHRTALVMVTGDRGLCGGFNSNIIRQVEIHLKVEQGETQLVPVGRIGHDWYRRRTVPILKQYTSFFNDLAFTHATSIGSMIIDLYTRLELDRVEIIYNEFKSAVRQDVVVETLLPIDIEQGTQSHNECIYEPDAVTLLNSILPLHINYQLWRILLESYAAEQGARMTAMEAATDNAAEMIAELTLHYNQARQAAITTEISDIVGGAEAISN